MWISKTEFEDPQAVEIAEEMRVKLAKEFGVTVQGSCVTLRFYQKDDRDRKHLIQVSMVVYHIDNGQEEEFEDK